jgi:ribonuclease J
MIEESRNFVTNLLETGREHLTEWGVTNARVKEALGNYYFEQTKRRPMILPFIVKV